MRILHVTNVASVTGGTLNCALSMVKSFPECQCTVFSFSGKFSPEDQSLFPKGTVLRNGLNLNEMRGQHFDLVIYHNTPATRMPNADLANYSVYYFHSAYSGPRTAAERCDLQLCVSQHLANQLGMDATTVLHQPVHLPAYTKGPEDQKFCIGRICTPTPTKWHIPDVIPPVAALLDALGDKVRFEFVGATAGAREALEALGGDTTFIPASHEARSRMHHWQAMLYLSQVTESFGRTVREAQRCGCWPIVSKRGGFIEQIKDTGAGTLIDMNSRPHEQVVRAVKNLMDVPRQVIRDTCRKVGDENGSLKVWRDKFLDRLAKEMTCA